MTTLFGYVDAKERKRIGRRFAELSVEAHQRLDAINAEERKATKAAVEYCKETSRLAILADYASMHEEPVVTSGFLVSPFLVAYGRRHVAEMAAHAADSDRRKREEAGDGRK